MKTVKVAYDVFKVRVTNKPGAKPFLVINQTNDKIQSGWDDLITARQVARDLNLALNQGVIR